MEVDAIRKGEVGEDSEGEEELPGIVVAKRKAVEVGDNDTGEKTS